MILVKPHVTLLSVLWNSPCWCWNPVISPMTKQRSIKYWSVIRIFHPRNHVKRLSCDFTSSRECAFFSLWRGVNPNIVVPAALSTFRAFGQANLSEGVSLKPPRFRSLKQLGQDGVSRSSEDKRLPPVLWTLSCLWLQSPQHLETILI